MTEHNNPPAFPTGTWYDLDGTVLPYQEPGMTMLDYFAGLALSGQMALRQNATTAAKVSYEIANAMIEERNKWIK